jgi:hypothetical protein
MKLEVTVVYKFNLYLVSDCNAEGRSVHKKN